MIADDRTIHDTFFVGAVTARSEGGATVKNRLIVRELQRQGVRVTTFDTGKLVSDGVHRIGPLVVGLFRHRRVLLSLSNRGSLVLVILLRLLRPLRRGGVHALLAVGSSLPDTIQALPRPFRRLYVRSLENCAGVYVESEDLMEKLRSLGLSNVVLLRNPRPTPTLRWQGSPSTPKRAVFVSRITETKGVQDVIRAVEILRDRGTIVELDVYGPIDPAFESRFRDVVLRSDGSRYRGVLAPDLVSETLVEYDVFVLPTYWSSEGMPGVLVEAAMVGMPVVTSRFPAASELVEDEVSGLQVDARDIEGISRAIERLLTDGHLRERLTHCLALRAGDYDVERVVARLQSDLTSRGWR